VAVVTEPDVGAVAGQAGPEDPRHIVLADLAAQLLAGLAARAPAYEAAAASTPGALGAHLAALGRAKRSQAAALEPLARILGVPPAPAPPATAGPSPAWGILLGEAFQAERGIELIARELVRLAPDPAVRELAARAAADAKRDAAEVRKLYLRYT
jgi:hypothetical protein